jgi:hypothetical protein
MPEAQRVALEKRRLERELRGRGLSKSAARAEVARRYSARA